MCVAWWARLVLKLIRQVVLPCPLQGRRVQAQDDLSGGCSGVSSFFQARFKAGGDKLRMTFMN